jgi:hypothetical protein
MWKCNSTADQIKSMELFDIFYATCLASAAPCPRSISPHTSRQYRSCLTNYMLLPCRHRTCSSTSSASLEKGEGTQLQCSRGVSTRHTAVTGQHNIAHSRS